MASKVVKKIMAEETKLNLTPMLDCIFNLLFFFMMTLHFHLQEAHLEAYLPKDSGIFSNRPPVKLAQDPVVVRLVYTQNAKEAILWIGENSFQGEDKFLRLEKKLQELLGYSENPVIVIDPDITTPYQEIISTMDACRKVNARSSDKKYEIRFSIKAVEEPMKAPEEK